MYLSAILDPRLIRNTKFHIIIYALLVIDLFPYLRNFFGILYRRIYDYARPGIVLKTVKDTSFSKGVHYISYSFNN